MTQFYKATPIAATCPAELPDPRGREHPLDAEDPVADNNQRARFAALGLKAYAARTGCLHEPLGQVISDLLCDLKHLIDATQEGLQEGEPGGDETIETLLDRGDFHYQAEIRGTL
jgi:hypothetical protein